MAAEGVGLAGEVRPPRGRLFQETLRHSPFWMLVACQLVNLTTWEAARPAFGHLVVRYLAPTGLAVADPEDLQLPLRPLGLWRRRALTLPRFADAWLQAEVRTYDQVLRLPGCGRYAADSWGIFMEGRTDVRPADGKLRWYLKEMACRNST